MILKQVIEALVFASPKPITTKEIVAALRGAGVGTENADALEFAKLKEDDVLAALSEIEAELAATGRAFKLAETVRGWTLMSDPLCAIWVRQLYPEAKPTRLTGPQLETLAIIAYRQPVTRADIEAVRGVSVDGVMQVLLDRSLVKIAGRAEVPGRPLLYETTEYFLQHFGLKTVEELPNSAELKRVNLPKAPVEEEKPAAAEAPAAETPAEAAPETAEVAAESEPEATPEAEPEPAPETAEPEPVSEPEPEPEPPVEEPAPEPDQSEISNPKPEIE